MIENGDRASLDVAINRVSICGDSASIHFVGLFGRREVLIDAEIKNTVGTFELRAASRKRVEDLNVSRLWIELEHLARIEAVEPHHPVRSDIALRAAGVIVAIFRRRAPGLKLFGFDVEHGCGASLITSW